MSRASRSGCTRPKQGVPTRVTIADIAVDGHSATAGHLVLAHGRVAPILFGFELSQGDAMLVRASFTFAHDHPPDICLRFPFAAGSVTLTPRTEMAPGYSTLSPGRRSLR